MKKIIAWLKSNMGIKCPKCGKHAVWRSREESLKTATFNVYVCQNCKSEYV